MMFRIFSCTFGEFVYFLWKKYFVYFLIGLFVLLLLFSCKSPICVLDTVIWKCFLPFCKVSFHFVDSVLSISKLIFLFACALGVIIYEIFA